MTVLVRGLGLAAWFFDIPHEPAFDSRRMIPAEPALSAPLPAPTAPPTAPARALIEAQLGMLTRLAQIGMEIAEAAGQEARAAAATATAAPEEGAAPAREHRRDPGLAFARVARAVRMTIALQSRLLKDLADLDRAEASAERDRKFDRRLRLNRLVGRAVEEGALARRDDGGGSDDSDWDEDTFEDEVEQLASEACERLTEAEDGDLWGRSFDEVVAGVCKDLGLSPDWCARLRAAVVAPADDSGDAPGGGLAATPSAEPSAPPPPDPEPPRLMFTWLGSGGPTGEPPPAPS